MTGPHSGFIRRSVGLFNNACRRLRMSSGSNETSLMPSGAYTRGLFSADFWFANPPQGASVIGVIIPR
ncbi:MAG: hypothetical protein QOD99_564 [Chthoniobacter sp.]|nr:hypothetical protein [Chthoniobacter sp.]